MTKTLSHSLVSFLMTVVCCSCFMSGRSAISEPQDKGIATADDTASNTQPTVTRRVLTANIEKALNKIADDGKVRPDFQRHLIHTAWLDGAAEAWGLFSEAGYVNAGQYMIYRLDDQSGRREWAKRNQNKIQGPDSIDKKRLENFQSRVQHASALKTYNPPSFDGLRYEFLHIKINRRGETTVVKRLYMNNPPHAADDKYQTLISAFTKWSED